MLQLYTTPNCSSCRKVKKYFEKFDIKYSEKNIFSIPLTKEDIFKMLRYSENGFDDIISTRSKIIKEQNIDIDSMKTNDLVEFIIAHPSILKRPIIMSEEEIQVGYNDDDITLFLPQEIRDIECEHCFSDDECEFFEAFRRIKK